MMDSSFPGHISHQAFGFLAILLISQLNPMY